MDLETSLASPRISGKGMGRVAHWDLLFPSSYIKHTHTKEDRHTIVFTFKTSKGLDMYMYVGSHLNTSR